MLKKYFPLASVVGLGGIVVWAGCSSDPAPAGGLVDGGGGGGDGSSNSSGGDGSSSSNNDGSTSTPNDSGLNFKGVDITFGECPAFTKCGGDTIGSFKVSGGCLSNEALNQIKGACAGVQEHDIVIKADGTVDVTETTVARKTEINMAGALDFPKTCSGFPVSCSQAQTLLTSNSPQFQGFKFDTATCTDNGNGCTCSVTKKIVEDTSDTYENDGQGTITTAANGNQQERTFEYCVNGAQNTYKETTGESPANVIIQLTKK